MPRPLQIKYQSVRTDFGNGSKLHSLAINLLGIAGMNRSKCDVKQRFRSGPKPGLSLLLLAATVALSLAAGHSQAQPRSVDYAEPVLLIGNIFALDARPAQCLFKSERRSTRNGDTVRV